MTPEQLQAAYERLAVLHTETMAELVETQKRMDAMSKSWWLMLKHRIKVLMAGKPQAGICSLAPTNTVLSGFTSNGHAA